MTTKTKYGAAKKTDDLHTFETVRTEGKTDGEILADVMLGGDARHGYASSLFACAMLGADVERPSLTDAVKFIEDRSNAAAKGDLAFASRMLAAQASTLDAMFTDMARRAQLNAGQYLDAAEKYGRLAFKAQSNCRTTLEALGKLHQPREQTVRHVHVNEGGQAIVAEHFHAPTGVGENEKSSIQSHEPGAAASSCAALPCKDPTWDGMPMPQHPRPEAVPIARRKSGRSEGQP